MWHISTFRIHRWFQQWGIKMDSESAKRTAKRTKWRKSCCRIHPIGAPVKKRKEDCRENSKNSMRLRRGPRRKDTNMSGAKLKVRKLKDHF